MKHGLRLTLGGAPATPHFVLGVPGFFWPGEPTPVGGDGDAITLDDARRYSDDETIPLELVEYPELHDKKHRARCDAALQEATGAIVQARENAPEVNEPEQINDQVRAVKAGLDTPSAGAEEE